MFGKKSVALNRYIIAVKNYNDTMDKLKKGMISLPYEKDVYLKMLESQNSKVDSLKEIGKFARSNKKSLKEVGHYWEGLIADGYTLVNVEYLEKIPSIDHVCSNETIKFVCIG
jgi:hypothetical protein